MKLRFLLLPAFCLLIACSTPPEKPKPVAEAKPTLRLTLLPQNALEAGKAVTVWAKLNNIKQRTIVTPDQLETVHGQKFRLLLINPTLTDYQQLNPQPTSTPGVFSFTFRPKTSDGYRAWADVTPAGGKEEFPMSEELGADRLGDVDKTESSHAAVGGYRFTLSFDKPLTAGGESRGTITITDRNDQPVTALPIEITGFYDDFRTVIRLYGTAATQLTFRFTPPKAGFVKLFAYINIGTKKLNAPFSVRIGK